MSAFLKSVNDASRVVGPLGLVESHCLGEGNGGFGLADGAQAHFIAVVGSSGDDDVALDGERQHEAVAIVDVLSNQIDATGGGSDEGGFASERLLEEGLGVRDEVSEWWIRLQGHELEFGVIRKLYL